MKTSLIRITSTGWDISGTSFEEWNSGPTEEKDVDISWYYHDDKTTRSNFHWNFATIAAFCKAVMIDGAKSMTLEDGKSVSGLQNIARIIFSNES